MLENSSKASKLRTTLSVFERSKFFFNLPGFLVESIEAGRYDAALRDYKKGKVLLETRPGQLLPIGAPKDGHASAAAEKQQKRILNKVWATVEKAMGEMRKVLLAKLQDQSRTVDEQEKTIEYDFFIQRVFTLILMVIRILLELNIADDPAWTYFDAQHKYLMQQMNSSYRTAVSNIKSSLSS